VLLEQHIVGALSYSLATSAANPSGINQTLIVWRRLYYIDINYTAHIS